MKKILTILLFVTIILCGCDNSSKSDFYKNYKKEKITKCPSFDEVKENPELEEKYGCMSGGSDLFSEKTIDLASDFAKQLKYIFKTQDIETLSEIVSYPVYINNYPNREKTIIINSKEELLKLDKNILLSNSIYDSINKNHLFWNWRGFALGEGYVWFWADDKKGETENKISDLSISIDNKNTSD